MSSDYKGDTDALEPKAVEKGKDDQDPDADDLVVAFNQMGVSRKCQMCTTEYASSFSCLVMILTYLMSIGSRPKLPGRADGILTAGIAFRWPSKRQKQRASNRHLPRSEW